MTDKQAEQAQEPEDPFHRFERHVDLLLEQFKVEKADTQRVDLKPEDLSVQLKLAAKKMVEDVAVELGVASIEPLALTLLSIYNNGVYQGGFINKNMDKVAQILMAAREVELPIKPEAGGDVQS